MNNEFDIIGLYDHNAESYNKVKEAFNNDDVVAIVHATGTGKSYNAIQLAYDNKDKKIIYVVPSYGIIEHIRQIIDENPNLDYELDFSNLEFRTYQSFINLSQEEIEKLDVDLLILDEFHHIGAPVWGARIDSIIETHENLKIFGMTAYTVRDRGTSYERDMALSGGDELFSDSVVSRYDLCDAMIDGVLPKPIYKSAYTNLIGLESQLEEKVLSGKVTEEDKKLYEKILNDVKKRIADAPSIADVVKQNIKPDGKYIYFCPLAAEEGVNDIETIKKEAMEWFGQVVKEEDIIFYTTTSEMGEEGKLNRKAFYNDTTLGGESVDGKLRVMFAINQYNEGIHAPNVDGVIMGRGTHSDIIYFEQLGRALSVRGDTSSKFEEYEKYSVEELINICKEKDILISDNLSKTEIIEKLIAPIVIDLTNNYDFIRELENNLKDKVKEIQTTGETLGKRITNLSDASFDIEVMNQDLFEMLQYVTDRLTMKWEDKYELAKKYYEYNGHLEIPQSFKTFDGITYDENGIKLGIWLQNIRQNKNLDLRRKQLLLEIGMRFEDFDEIEWNKKYELAKKYYEYNGHLEIPQSFKTFDGITYDENGINLGMWIQTQRRNKKLSLERRELLEEIGMRFEIINLESEWNKKYELAKKYYEIYGDLEIPYSFKTFDGITYDEDGIKLGIWLNTQRQNKNIDSNRLQLLDKIGINFIDRREESWNKKYELAKKYYEHYGNLEISIDFKTIDGITYDEQGINLGVWIAHQKIKENLDPSRKQLLEEIGMNFEIINKEEEWNKKYELTKKYYEYHGNLNMPKGFKTVNGIEYDENGIRLGEWLVRQRKNKKLEPNRKQLLEEIGMRFEIIKLNVEWNDMYELAKKYYEHYGNLEIKKRFKTVSGIEYDENGIGLGEWLVRQRKNKNLDPERKQLLEEIGMQFESFKDVKWQENYELAKKYYEYYGNLEISIDFKTIDGITYDENGNNLGQWLSYQKKNKNLELSRKQLLEKIGMRTKKLNDIKWQENYELAKKYYEHYGNLEVPASFKTLNGVNYDENGTSLGAWISNQRSKENLEPSIKKILEEIGMRFEDFNQVEWNRKYELAKKYYGHYGNLEIPYSFKTIDGINYDEDGINLGFWIGTQKKNKNLDIERKQLLLEIGMCFENLKDIKWQENYGLVKKYYEYHGNLEIPYSFKTSDGVNYDENGINLAVWINTQRQNKNLDPNRKQLLEEIGMHFEIIDKESKWNEKYDLAKKYYELHGHLEIPRDFKTLDGITYDENGIKLGIWVNNQRKSKNMDSNRLRLLEKIGFKSAFVRGMITEKNSESTNKELIDRLNKLLEEVSNEINNKQDVLNIEQEFNKKLI